MLRGLISEPCYSRPNEFIGSKEIGWAVQWIQGQFQNTFDNKTDESGSAFFFVYVALRSGTRAGQLLHVLDSAFNYRNK